MEAQRKSVALVTGGSSGIGLELARLFVADGHDVVIAADERAKLEEAAQTLLAAGESPRVEAVEADLSGPDGPGRRFTTPCGTSACRSTCWSTTPASASMAISPVRRSLAAEVDMIQLNAVSVVQLTKLFVRDMVARRSGKILFTASLASLSATPFLTVYAATKAFVYSFAEGIREELKDTGVTVTALLPGATDTSSSSAPAPRTPRPPKGTSPTPPVVAKAGYEALKKGDDHVVAPWKNKVVAVLDVEPAPDHWVMLGV